MTKQATVESIINQFTQLVMEKDFIKLTVSELCEATGISRNTFYKYFKDKNEIVEQILHRDIVIPMDELRKLYVSFELPSTMILEWQYQQFYEQRKFYERISAFTGQNSFYEFIMKHTSIIIQEKIKPLQLPEKEQEYMVYFYASSHTMLLLKWIRDGMVQKPKIMASYYEKWTIPIFQHYTQKR